MTIRETESFQHQHVAEKLRERIRTVGSHNNCDATPTNENIEAQKVAYDDKINRLHESNKELKRLHVELQREITTISQRNEQQNNKLQSELVKVKADFDAKKIDTARLESRLDCFEDELKEFEVQKLKIACRDGSSHTKRIKDLDER